MLIQVLHADLRVENVSQMHVASVMHGLFSIAILMCWTSFITLLIVVSGVVGRCASY